MKPVTVHDRRSAPPESRAILAGLESKLGFIPNLYGVMAGSPALLEGFVALSGQFEKSSLDPQERLVVLLTVSRVNQCSYCIAAHSTIADLAQVDPQLTEALRSGAPLANPKLEALRRFVEHLLHERGWAKPAEVDALYAAGYREQTVLDVLIGVGLKTITNFLNHTFSTPLDAAFAPRAWSREAVKTGCAC